MTFPIPEIMKTLIQNTKGIKGCGCDLGSNGSQGFCCGMNIGNTKGITGTYLCNECMKGGKHGKSKD